MYRGRLAADQEAVRPYCALSHPQSQLQWSRQHCFWGVKPYFRLYVHVQDFQRNIFHPGMFFGWDSGTGDVTSDKLCFSCLLLMLIIMAETMRWLRFSIFHFSVGISCSFVCIVASCHLVHCPWTHESCGNFTSGINRWTTMGVV